MTYPSTMPEPAGLLAQALSLCTLPDPVLDLACGDCHNGVALALKGHRVVCLDAANEALERARRLADACGVTVELVREDLEQPGSAPLPEEAYGTVLVFRYLHRPLIPHIRKALRSGGILVYETFTVDQPRYGHPHNPDFLLQPGELARLFEDWEVLYQFEGTQTHPKRAVAQIVCRKPV